MQTLPLDSADRSEGIVVYSELLSNIKKLSIHVQLPTRCRGAAQITLLDGGSAIEVRCDETHSITPLPATIKVAGNVIKRPASTDPEWTLRLPITTSEAAETTVNTVPWTATSLTTDREVSCRSCAVVLVKRSAIKLWKDLPSESWAEMMEFWHCHKPEEPEDQAHQTSGKGYAAAGRLHVSSGVGMVDTSTILIPAVNCSGDIKVATSTNELRCACDAYLGTLVENGAAYRLAKWTLAISLAPHFTPSTYPVERWMACRLLQAVEEHGVRRFVATRSAKSLEAVSIWVFAPSLHISHTGNGVQHVIKVMWKDISALDALKLDAALASRNSSTELLTMTEQDFVQLRDRLQASQEMLPRSLHTFQDWSVGLLPRFTQSDG